MDHNKLVMKDYPCHSRSERKRPQLEHLRRTSPQDLAYCEGYVWHLESVIGKGLYGRVHLGWNAVRILWYIIYDTVASKASYCES